MLVVVPSSLTSIEVQFGHLQSECLTVSPAEAEYNHWLQLPFHYHLDHLEAAGATLLSFRSSSPPTVLQHGHRRLEVVFTKVALEWQGAGAY